MLLHPQSLWWVWYYHCCVSKVKENKGWPSLFLSFLWYKDCTQEDNRNGLKTSSGISKGRAVVALCFTVSIVLCLFSAKKTLTRHLYLSELTASPSAHLEVFHDSSHLIFFSQHMDGTITPYNIFSHQPGYFAAHSIIRYPPPISHFFPDPQTNYQLSPRRRLFIH